MAAVQELTEELLVEPVDVDDILPVVKYWGEFKEAAFEFLENGNTDAVRRLARYFVGRGSNEKEKYKRGEILKFVHKRWFAEKPLNEQKAMITEASMKQSVFYNLSLKFERESEKAINGKHALRIAQKYKRIIREKGLEVCHDEETDFIDRAKLRAAGKQDVPYEIVRPKSQEELEAGKYMTNILSPNSYNYLKLKSKNGEGSIKFIRKEVTPGKAKRSVQCEIDHLSDKVEMAIDFLFDRLSKRNGDSSSGQTDAISKDEFEYALKNPREYRNHVEAITFTSTEFRKHFDLRITDRDLRRAVDELLNTSIKLEGIKVWYESGNGQGQRYKKITHTDRLVYSATTVESGRTAPRTGAAQHRFTVVIGLGWSLIFRNDVINQRFGCFRREFYKVNKRARAIGRYISCWPSSTLTIGQISEIAGYEDTTNLRKRKKDIEARLDELKRIGIIRRWRRVKKKGKEMTGANTSWSIMRA